MNITIGDCNLKWCKSEWTGELLLKDTYSVNFESVTLSLRIGKIIACSTIWSGIIVWDSLFYFIGNNREIIFFFQFHFNWRAKQGGAGSSDQLVITGKNKKWRDRHFHDTL